MNNDVVLIDGPHGGVTIEAVDCHERALQVPTPVGLSVYHRIHPRFFLWSRSIDYVHQIDRPFILYN